MKLHSLINKENRVTFSEEDFLNLENHFLRTELDINELEHSIELMETIKACVEKEGSVSSSLEIMFGENFSSSENLVAELDAALLKAYEGLGEKIRELTSEGKDAALDGAVNSIKEKLKAISDADLEKVSYPVEVVEGHWLHRMDEASHFLRNIIADDKILKETKGADFIKKAKELVGKYRDFISKIKENRFESGRIISVSSAGALKAYIEDLVKALDEYPEMNKTANEAKQDFKDIVDLVESIGLPDQKAISEAKQAVAVVDAMGNRVVYMLVHLTLKGQLMVAKKILAKVGGKSE